MFHEVMVNICNALADLGRGSVGPTSLARDVWRRNKPRNRRN